MVLKNFNQMKAILPKVLRYALLREKSIPNQPGHGLTLGIDQGEQRVLPSFKCFKKTFSFKHVKKSGTFYPEWPKIVTLIQNLCTHLIFSLI